MNVFVAHATHVDNENIIVLGITEAAARRALREAFITDFGIDGDELEDELQDWTIEVYEMPVNE